ncbi:MAG: YbhB/YbcL family Raf kinase inhibitor-like protein [Candidatus Heimdallarchaeota archaeon]|nr:YbhB/YbcL family Raf kinase inhibitor-like protein [Candidatus Heimdallarchaeota archaeon]
MSLTSSAFKHNEKMPKKYSCQGEEVNPPLEISGIPKGAKSLVLLMEDPDTPIKVTFTHWVICHLEPNVKKIKENDSLENAIVGRNSLGQNKYLGPCPPWGKHRYIFKLFAVDEKLPLTAKSKKRNVLKSMKGHIIEQAELIGLYEREKKEEK